jgi:hypothetical protein
MQITSTVQDPIPLCRVNSLEALSSIVNLQPASFGKTKDQEIKREEDELLAYGSRNTVCRRAPWSTGRFYIERAPGLRRTRRQTASARLGRDGAAIDFSVGTRRRCPRIYWYQIAFRWADNSGRNPVKKSWKNSPTPVRQDVHSLRLLEFILWPLCEHARRMDE